jgi:hypothetical protein
MIRNEAKAVTPVFPWNRLKANAMQPTGISI